MNLHCAAVKVLKATLTLLEVKASPSLASNEDKFVLLH